MASVCSVRAITKAQARRALLSHQGLWPPRAISAEGYFQRVGSMQFDPVDLFGISPEISLCARVKGFRKGHLSDWLYKSRHLVDMWDKCACVSRAQDAPFLQQNRHMSDDGWHARLRHPQLAEQARERALDVLRERGIVSSAAFAGDPEARAALERMVVQGEAAVHHREGRRRFFALAQALGGRIEASELSREALHDRLVLRRVGAVGLLWNRRSDAFLGINDMGAADRGAAFERLCASGALGQVRVEGVKDVLYYNVRDEGMFEAGEAAPRAALLGPLDNLLWDRRLVEELFSFSYRWEIYTPPQKRLYGPYAVPLLYGDRFLGRIQLAVKKGVLSVAGWWPEAGLRLTKRMAMQMQKALEAHAAMLGATLEDGLAL